MAKATILLVQNAKTHGNGTKRYLEGTGFDVVWTGSGVAALAAAKQRAVDLILLDAALPDIEATELCHLFRTRERTSAVPILLLTAPGYAPYRSNGKSRGPDDVLAKPYTVSELDVRLAALLRTNTPPAGPMEPEQVPPLPPQPASQAVPEPAVVLPPEHRPLSVPAPQTGIESPAEPAPATVTVVTAEGGPAAAEHLQQPPAPNGAASSAQPAAGSAEPAMSPPAPGKETPPEPKAEDHLPAGAPMAASAGSEVIDPETGLFARAQFEAMFSKEFKRSARFKQQMSCMLIDLDGRKIGREADEATLKAIVGLVQSTIREVDTAAWWSGEALIILLPNTIRNDAVQAAARILEAVAIHPFTWSDSTKVTMSIGVAGLPDRKIDTEQKLIDAAAAACNRARSFMQP